MSSTPTSNFYEDSFISLKEKVHFLSNKQSYPDRPNNIEIIETHMSWVFMTKDFVYKLKKPVKINSLDYSTLLKRKMFCNEELKLNSFLAPSVYLDVVSLTLNPFGNLKLQGNGKVVEWLVKMRRLPADCTLDYKLKAHTVSEKDIININNVLVKFYNKTEKIELSPSEYCKRIEDAILANGNELSLPQYQLPNSLIESIINNQLEFLLGHSELLAQRANNNKIVDAHGDLRPEHIYLLKNPTIIDRLEFNRELRMLDPVDELSFLSLECERLGDLLTANLVLDVYSNLTNDIPSLTLINFYKSHRACKRAKVAIRHLNDSITSNVATKWTHKAKNYLDIANKYAQKLDLEI